MPAYLSAQQIADHFGVHKATINRIAAANAIGCLVGQQRVFQKKDVAKIKRFCKFSVGNPNFGKKPARNLLRQPKQ